VTVKKKKKRKRDRGSSQERKMQERRAGEGGEKQEEGKIKNEGLLTNAKAQKLNCFTLHRQRS